MNRLPKISIITVVRNGEKYIEGTIESIISQTYANIEYIVIDGNSTDRTTDIIRKHEKNISYWISEPDKGIYDAMNKGVKASSGEWLLFINSDDYLLNNTVIEQAVPLLNQCKSLIVYGQVRIIFPVGAAHISGDAWEKLQYRFRNVAMCFPHQGTFHSNKLFKEGLFDTSYKIAGDYDFLLRYLNNNDADYIPLIIAEMRAGGISQSSSKITLLRETRKVQIKNKIYKSIPPMAWFISATHALITDFIIRSVGITGKDKIKKLIGKNAQN